MLRYRIHAAAQLNINICGWSTQNDSLVHLRMNSPNTVNWNLFWWVVLHPTSLVKYKGTSNISNMLRMAEQVEAVPERPQTTSLDHPLWIWALYGSFRAKILDFTRQLSFFWMKSQFYVLIVSLQEYLMLNVKNKKKRGKRMDMYLQICIQLSLIMHC